MMVGIDQGCPSVLALSNRIRREAIGLKDIGLPLDAFPQKLQGIIFDVTNIEQFNMEYLAMSMLSAAATAIGNSCQIRIRGSWRSSPALYVILIGRPGQGKTPPLDYAYRPLQEHDFLQVSRFIEENKHYAEQNAGARDGDAFDKNKPVLIQTILSDLTQEAMMRIHNDNQRGIVILVDEIMGFFKSFCRYNDSPLLTQLLTAYSGKPLKVSRCSNPIPIIIPHPCINIVGTTQTQRIGELFTKENVSSGLIDRILFLHPKSREIPKMQLIQDAGLREDDRVGSVYRKWKQVIDKLLSIEPDFDEKGIIACDEIHMQHIDVRSVQAAIRLYDYLELSYQEIKAQVQKESMSPLKKSFLDGVQPDFTTADAIKAGAEIGLCESAVKKNLAKMCVERTLQKTGHGTYRKIL